MDKEKKYMKKANFWLRFSYNALLVGAVTIGVGELNKRNLQGRLHMASQLKEDNSGIVVKTEGIEKDINSSSNMVMGGSGLLILSGISYLMARHYGKNAYRKE